MPIRGEVFAEAVGNGAEVLADDDGAVAPGFQRHQPQHVVQGIGQVGTGLGALRHQPQAAQSEHVIDAQAASVAQARAQRFDERHIAVPLQAARGEGGESPVLAAGIEQVRRCAYAQAGEHILLPAPHQAAAGGGADGEVGDQADAHTRVARLRLCVRQAAVCQPLQEQVEADLSCLFRGRSVPPRRWSDRAAVPATCANAIARVAGQRGRMQRFEGGVFAQRAAAGLDEAATSSYEARASLVSFSRGVELS